MAKKRTRSKAELGAIRRYYAEKKKAGGQSSPWKETFPHFRRYKKNNHPAMIVAERSADEYEYRKVMHSERDGRHLNEKVFPNPDPTDKEPMYIGKRVRHDKKIFFGKILPWKYKK